MPATVAGSIRIMTESRGLMLQVVVVLVIEVILILEDAPPLRFAVLMVNVPGPVPVTMLLAVGLVVVYAMLQLSVVATFDTFTVNEPEVPVHTSDEDDDIVTVGN